MTRPTLRCFSSEDKLVAVRRHLIDQRNSALQATYSFLSGIVSWLRRASLRAGLSFGWGFLLALYCELETVNWPQALLLRLAHPSHAWPTLQRRLRSHDAAHRRGSSRSLGSLSFEAPRGGRHPAEEVAGHRAPPVNSHIARHNTSEHFLFGQRLETRVCPTRSVPNTRNNPRTLAKRFSVRIS